LGTVSRQGKTGVKERKGKEKDREEMRKWSGNVWRPTTSVPLTPV